MLVITQNDEQQEECQADELQHDQQLLDNASETSEVVGVASYNPCRWGSDTSASTHIVGSTQYFVAYHEFDKAMDHMQGFAKGGQAAAHGIGVIAPAVDAGDGALTIIFLEETR
ncbi:hypothetical protein PC128_g21065 [Phytophthora cactorum]|nr:hypothetical protein PC128_g21065 [Phytophthora cactorum]